MALNIKRLGPNGIQIEPVATSSIDKKGELEVLNAGGVLQYHDGTAVRKVVLDTFNGNISVTGDLTITGKATIDNIEIDGNTVKSVNTDGDIIIDPNGNGDVDIVVSGTGVVNLGSISVTIDASGNMTINGRLDVDNIRIDGNTISSQNTNGDIILDPNGSGNVIVDSLSPSQPVKTNASKALVSGAIDLSTSDVTGVLPVAHGGTGSNVQNFVDLSTNQTVGGNKVFQGIITLENEFNLKLGTDNSSTGNLPAVSTSGVSVIRFTNNTGPTLQGLANGSDAKLLIISYTGTGVMVVENESTAASASNRIITGSGQNLELESNSSLWLYYDSNSNRWRVIGGTGAGSRIAHSVVAGENLANKQPVYISKGSANGDAGRTAERAYILDPTNDNRMEFVGVVIGSTTAGNVAKIAQVGLESIPVSLIDGGAFIPGEPVYWNGTQYTSTDITTPGVWSIMVGKALDSTKLIINPDLAASAKYNELDPLPITIQNAVSTPINLGLAPFNGATVSAFSIEYHVRRIGGSVEKSEAGELRGSYNANSGTWSIVNYGIVDDAEIDFFITNTGQIQYTTSSMPSPHTGEMKLESITIEPASSDSATIANNQTSFVNIPGLFFNGSSTRSANIFYMVRRSVTGNEISESGEMRVVYNSTSASWSIAVYGIAGNAGITFGITSGGQLQYQTTNLTGSGYSGNIYWKITSEIEN